MVDRRLRALPCPPYATLLDVWAAPLAAALDGTGPALVPVPDGPAGAAVAAMAQVDEPLESEEIALVVPTSGSTGVPKGALLAAEALAASGRATYERLGGAGRWLLALPVTHIAGLQVLARSLLAGGLPEVLDLGGGFDPAAFAEATARLGGGRRYTSLVPTQLARLLDAGGPAVDALASYDAVLLGGAAAAPALLDRARAAGVRVSTTYGMSETCGGCVYDGVPLDGVEVRLDERERIRLGGDVAFSGYRLRPDLTAEALVVEDGRRLHVTQDLGRWSDGRLQVVGRIDDVVVTGGEKVAPSSVESALAALDVVHDAAVVGADDPEWGQRVVAVVVPSTGTGPGLEQLRELLRPSLPAYALPLQLLLMDAIPLLPSGKPDRRALRALIADSRSQPEPQA